MLSSIVWVIVFFIGLIVLYVGRLWLRRERKEKDLDTLKKDAEAWRYITNMNYSTNIGAIIVAIIVLIVALPKNGILMDYRLDYCNDEDKIDVDGIRTSDDLRDTESVNINYHGFYACEIGVVNANVEITIDLLSDLDCELEEEEIKYCDLNFLILDKDDYHNFVSGEAYSIHNLALASLSKNWDGRGTTSAYIEKITLLFDTYYFVMNWEYRITYESEDLSSRNTYESAYTSIFNENDSDFDFYYALDIDYTEDNRKGNL